MVVVFLMDIDFILIRQISIYAKTSGSGSATTKNSGILTIGYLNCIFNTICRQDITNITLTLHIKCNQQFFPSKNRNHFITSVKFKLVSLLLYYHSCCLITTNSPNSSWGCLHFTYSVPAR